MRQPKICQRQRRGKTTYFCEIGGRQYGLGTDPEAAQDQFADLLNRHRGRKQLGIDQPEAAEKPLTVLGVLLEFLDHCKRSQSEATYKFYSRAIAGGDKESKRYVPFATYLARQGKSGMLVGDFGPSVVEDWISEHFADASDNYKHNQIRPIQAAFNWAIKKRADLRKRIGANPLIGLEKPAQTPREAYINADQWAKIMATAEGEFLDLLIVLKETGARPQEARIVEAKQFDREGRRWYFPKPIKKVRGTPRPRIILLNDRAFEICQRLALKYPEGPLFRNEDGKSWTKNALNCRCKRMKEKLGFALQPYALRHTFCTDALSRGVDPLTVAELMGHANGLMVMRVYQKLSKCTDHLRAALVKATG